MKCIYCGSAFVPVPARRVICPACVAKRNKRMRQAAKPKAEKPKRPRIDHAALDRAKRIEIAQRSYQALVDEEWRQRNVIPFRVPSRQWTGGDAPIAA